MPLLLWLFLFYKLISEAFPGPRQAISLFWHSVFLSNRGLYFPVPLADPVHKWMGVALAGRHRRRRRPAPLGAEAPGCDRPALPAVSAGFGVALGLPLLVWLLGGAPHHMSWPAAQGLQLRGRHA